MNNFVNFLFDAGKYLVPLALYIAGAFYDDKTNKSGNKSGLHSLGVFMIMVEIFILFNSLDNVTLADKVFIAVVGFGIIFSLVNGEMENGRKEREARSKICTITDQSIEGERVRDMVKELGLEGKDVTLEGIAVHALYWALQKEIDKKHAAEREEQEEK